MQVGSGLTFLVGGNNTGKTTVFEALRAFNSTKDNPPSFSERKRNVKCENGKIHLKLETVADGTYTIDTIAEGGSSTFMNKMNVNEGENWQSPEIFILQSRRFMEAEFYHSDMERETYIRSQQFNIHNRTANIYEFNARLFKMQKNKNEFDQLLKWVLGYDLEWTIEQNDNGMFYLKLRVKGCVHSSEGLGDGIWSVFTICDALYDSKKESVIAIDEPELSLHPAYQKKIMHLLNEYSKDRQIIINTHSPYFIDFQSLVNGAHLYRTVKNEEGNIELFALSELSRKSLNGFLNDLNQPHTLGTEAKEIFFLEDNIIVTEGQEDVIMYNKAAEQLHLDFSGEFFGWGSGGAANISKIVSILKDLGYKKVVALFDGDKLEEKEKLEKAFPMYKILNITLNDIRDKPAIKREQKDGMMKQNGVLKENCEEEMQQLVNEVNEYIKN